MDRDITQLRRQARSLLPAAVYDYYAGGSGRERTLRANERAWREYWLAPRVLRGVRSPDTSTRLLGAGLATPVVVAPTAFHQLAHPDAELATAAGAARAGALFVLSTRSSRRVEDVGAAVSAAGGRWWLQVYLMQDRSRTAGMVRRAAAAGAGALVLTADTPVVGRKRRDSRELALAGADLVANTGPVTSWDDIEVSAEVTFADIGWLKEVSGGLPVVVKGVLRADDALACAAAGASAVIVSNHGGRQLDGALPAARALPAVTAALAARAPAEPAGDAAGRVAAYVDGGIRSGEDVLAAISLGARAVLVGRPVLWALACGGADGVTSLLTALTDSLAHAMTLAGAASLAEVTGLAA